MCLTWDLLISYALMKEARLITLIRLLDSPLPFGVSTVRIAADCVSPFTNHYANNASWHLLTTRRKLSEVTAVPGQSCRAGGNKKLKSLHFSRTSFRKDVDSTELRWPWAYSFAYWTVPTLVFRPWDWRNKSHNNKKLKAVKLLQPGGRC
jgi:hypothetical protein